MERVVVATLVVLGVCAHYSPVIAQGSPQGLPLGRVSISARATDSWPQIGIPGFSSADVFVLIDLDYADIGRAELNVSTGILAWEGEFLIPPEFAILSKIVRNHSLSVIEHSTNLIVGLSPVITAAETPTDLVHYRIGYFAGPDPPVDVWVTLGPSSPSSFDSESPGFNDNVDVGECTRASDGTPVSCLRPFAAVFGAVINCRTTCFWVPIETPSWSALKASYGG
jgi:hypothetical protein